MSSFDNSLFDVFGSAEAAGTDEAQSDLEVDGRSEPPCKAL